MTDIKLQQVAPGAIEQESFRIIEQELGSHFFPSDRFAVIRRVIHATGDFSFAESLVFHPDAITSGLEAIRSGLDILVDINMAAAGISKKLLADRGGQVRCNIGTQKANSTRTRSEMAIEEGLEGGNVGIVAIGNAPTALLAAMRVIDRNPDTAPALLIGVPVGFVNAAESKAILEEKNYPFITNRGRKGGTPVAVAIVNALIRLANGTK